jgi:hypothetical protein
VLSGVAQERRAGAVLRRRAPGGHLAAPGRRAAPAAGDDAVLVRHEQPEDGVDQDLAAGDDQQDQDEQQPRGPRVEPEAPAQAGAHAGEYAALAGAHQALVGELVTDVVHGGSLLSPALVAGLVR